ncbi:hypothetical protein P3T35_005031 [Kitasatospora sp. GP30]|uniref:DinB family protein n=1 Tax=Kitasatospora sp. GP30 TaxID=3035084 RepID=UPI000C702828|nr:DinB family protein [Kitasatospora sp. GP30]MDH6143003.1 hypothetical protein [Kitasatospora sp. GP30]
MTDDHDVLSRAAADLEAAVRTAVGALAPVSAADWSVPAAELSWDCWETIEHLADGLFAYALQLGPARPPLDDFVQLSWRRERPGSPTLAISVDREAGPAALLEAVEAAGAVLTAMVRTAAPTTRAFHAYGVSDPEGFAAMGVVETLVHADDVARGLGVEWAPPADPCARALARLFPEVEVGDDPWATLRWATGRAELPGRPGQGRREFERWHSAPLG